ncbi:hypothetical protein BS50DRAFT_2045 [Corynespora cassiicola Philippines]|uniref:Uncharacterized protein n=1 Tax=Corynespora cassiicola Philippines TaxID=1448308 RepID=A0A2T2P885_CORCC|nr:hypothetical protein BS50DRAFT_2045 [Corynespora cassiicola Philippines]
MSELRKTKDAMMERHDNFQAAISRQAMLINNNAKSQERTLKTIPDRLSTLERLHTNHASSLQAGQDAIASALQSGLADIKSTTTFSAANTHTLVSVVRAVLTSELSPMLEDASAKILAQNSTLIRQLERGIERISQDMGHAIAEEEDGTSISQSSSGEDPQTCPRPYTFPGAVIEKGSLVNGPIIHGHPSVPNHQAILRIPLHAVTSVKRSWMMNWKIGRLQIAIETTNHRRDGSPSCKSQTSVEIHFRPAQNFMSLPGLAISWTDAPNHRGFYNMTPGVSVIQIIPTEHPIFKAIAWGDISFIQEELASGRVNLRCENTNGDTLLHLILGVWWKLTFFTDGSMVWKSQFVQIPSAMRSFLGYER